MNRIMLILVVATLPLRMLATHTQPETLSEFGHHSLWHSIKAFEFPGTEIILFDLTYEKSFALHNPRNITNRKGYDNQPSFAYTPDTHELEILYTSDRGGQTDIFQYHIKKSSTKRLTNTPESEFSPTMMPDKTHLSAVRIELDSIQRLWRFNLDGSAPEVIGKKIKNVGYHCWMGSNMYALFIVGEPNSLHVSIVGAKTSTFIANNIGRCMKKIPRKSELGFTSINKEGQHILSKMNIYTREITPLMPTKGNGQDFTWLPDGTVLMAEDNQLFRANPNGNKKWQLVHTFDKTKFKGITRISTDEEGRHLAIVVSE